MTRSTVKILETPIAEWPQAINSTRTSLQDVEHELSGLIQRAALLESYISHRFNTGCGDRGHKASAKQANKTLAKVRAALGFSYPKNLPLSIQ